ncbi:MAG: restriction endonuclease subunit S [Erysipelotrichaceae bacterium]|nr:restriction endonuclease subunit S [Erysipelotrichaceae bacterium]
MEYITLKEVCTINMGQSPDSSSYNENEEGIPFFQGNADFGERYPVTRIWCNDPTKIAHAGDILISVRAPIGALNYAKETCCIGRGLAAITPDLEKVSSEFIFWLLKAKNAELNLMGTGSTFKAIGRKVLEETQVPNIGSQQQHEYATNLEKVNNIIQMRKQELLKLDDLIKARFVEMFGNEKNLIPMSDICSIITDGTHQPPKFRDAGIPFIFVSNITGDKVTYDAEKFIDQDTYDELIKRTPIEIGDVLLSTVGSYGHPAVVKSDKKFLFQRHIAYLKPRREIIDSDYLHGAILSPDAQLQIEEGVKGIAQKTLNLSEIKKMRIPVPSMDRQKEFSALVTQVDKSKVI